MDFLSLGSKNHQIIKKYFDREIKLFQIAYHMKHIGNQFNNARVW